MTTAILVLVISVGGLLVLGSLVGVLFGHRLLLSSLSRYLEVDEQVTFKSWATRGAGFLPFRLIYSYGAVVVTNRRLFFVSWLLPPFWKSYYSIRLREVEDLKVHAGLLVGQIEITANGEKTRLTPSSSDIGGYSSDLSSQLVQSIRLGMEHS